MALLVLPGSAGPQGVSAVSGSAAAQELIHSSFTAHAYLLVGVTVGSNSTLAYGKSEGRCAVHEVGGKLASQYLQY